MTPQPGIGTRDHDGAGRPAFVDEEQTEGQIVSVARRLEFFAPMDRRQARRVARKTGQRFRVGKDGRIRWWRVV